jgi:hypothetical protein
MRFYLPVQQLPHFGSDIVKAKDRRDLDVWVPGDARNLEQTQGGHRVRPASVLYVSFILVDATGAALPTGYWRNSRSSPPSTT